MQKNRMEEELKKEIENRKRRSTKRRRHLLTLQAQACLCDLGLLPHNGRDDLKVLMEHEGLAKHVVLLLLLLVRLL